MMVEKEVGEHELFQVIRRGNVLAFQNLVKEDPYLVDRVSCAFSNKTPLHIAALVGNEDIVEVMLRRNSLLTWKLDSHNSSALHIAAAEGDVRIVSMLLSEAPSMCWWRDRQGMNPIHVAAMKGHVEILEELTRSDPLPARERVDRGQTVLHLCVKHRQIGAFQFLVAVLGREFANEKDDDGDTVLNLAVRFKQFEVIRVLSDKKSVGMCSDTKLMEMARELVEKEKRGVAMQRKKRASRLRGVLVYMMGIAWCNILAFVLFVIVLPNFPFSIVISIFSFFIVACFLALIMLSKLNVVGAESAVGGDEVEGEPYAKTRFSDSKATIRAIPN